MRQQVTAFKIIAEANKELGLLSNILNPLQALVNNRVSKDGQEEELSGLGKVIC